MAASKLHIISAPKRLRIFSGRSAQQQQCMQRIKAGSNANDAEGIQPSRCPSPCRVASARWTGLPTSVSPALTCVLQQLRTTHGHQDLTCCTQMPRLWCLLHVAALELWLCSAEHLMLCQLQLWACTAGVLQHCYQNSLSCCHSIHPQLVNPHSMPMQPCTAADSAACMAGAVCNDGGDLVCCDGRACLRSFHADCLQPHLRPQPDEPPEQRWFCQDCRSSPAAAQLGQPAWH